MLKPVELIEDDESLAEAMAVAVASVAQEVKMISLGYSAPSSAAVC